MPLRMVLKKGPRSLGNCGGAEMEVAWVLGPNDIGYVVQHVVWEYGDFTCAGEEIYRPRRVEYWEAWEVIHGVVYAGRNSGAGNFHAAGASHDFYFMPDRGSGTYGQFKITGRARFLPADPRPTGWVAGSVEEAGYLPATTVPPTGWADAGTIVHDLTSKWNCCGEAHTHQFIGVPSSRRKETMKETPAPRGKVERLIHAVPAWAPGLTSEPAEVDKALSALRGVSLARLREGIERYEAHLRRHRAFSAPGWSRLYLVIRYVLALPLELPASDRRTFGGWVRFGEDRDSPIWPLSRGPDGEVRMSGRFGGYYGPAYDALGEFDHYLHFGPRFPKGARS